MSQPDAEQSLATTLFDTVKALQDHVEARAAEIAAAEIATACARHGQELAVAHHNAEIAQERADAVTGELRRLVDIRDKQLGQLRQMLREHGIDPNTGASARSATPTKGLCERDAVQSGT
jgi:biotin-(acetyl-CoA carboxylase) ligase